MRQAGPPQKASIPKKSFWHVVLMVLCLSNSVHAESFNTDQLDKTTLKALYAYQFGKFTGWPEKKLNAATKRIEYCVLGQNPFAHELLDLIARKSVQGRALSITLFDSGLAPEKALMECHVLWISQSEKHRLAVILTNLKQAPVLTISDITGFSKQGGMVTLMEKQGKVHFQINLQALQRAGLSVSSKIMELAERIDDRKP